MRVPRGLEKCAVCGEYNGQVRGSQLNWGGTDLDLDDELDRIEHQMATDMAGEVLTVKCLCQGIPCRRCKVNLIHRPGSNTYNESDNSVEHWPVISGLCPCRECRRKEAEQQGSQKA